MIWVEIQLRLVVAQTQVLALVFCLAIVSWVLTKKQFWCFSSWCLCFSFGSCCSLGASSCCVECLSLIGCLLDASSSCLRCLQCEFCIAVVWFAVWVRYCWVGLAVFISLGLALCCCGFVLLGF
ncbi:hypothetical protein U1Q18_016618 [Sarracenia purpurea var. burkii]